MISLVCSRAIYSLSPSHINLCDRESIFHQGPIKIAHFGGAVLEDEIYWYNQKSEFSIFIANGILSMLVCIRDT